MRKEMQSSRYVVISYLARKMGLDVVEATSVIAELEQFGLVQIRPNGDFVLKEMGGIS